VDRTRRLLSLGASPDISIKITIVDVHVYTALTWAADQGVLPQIRNLLNYGANMYLLSSKRDDCLMHCIKNNFNLCAVFIIASGYSLDRIPDNFEHLTMLEEYKCCVKSLKFLCRLMLRNSLKVKTPHALQDNLNIPRSIAEYIAITEQEFIGEELLIPLSKIESSLHLI